MSQCQSCGMPLRKDPQGGATEKDGSKSTDYCSLCRDQGEFHYKGTDAREFQKMVLEIMVKEGWWHPLAWLATRQIPRLKRWQAA